MQGTCRGGKHGYMVQVSHRCWSQHHIHWKAISDGLFSAATPTLCCPGMHLRFCTALKKPQHSPATWTATPEAGKVPRAAWAAAMRAGTRRGSMPSAASLHASSTAAKAARQLPLTCWLPPEARASSRAGRVLCRASAPACPHACSRCPCHPRCAALCRGRLPEKTGMIHRVRAPSRPKPRPYDATAGKCMSWDMRRCCTPHGSSPASCRQTQLHATGCSSCHPVALVWRKLTWAAAPSAASASCCVVAAEVWPWATSAQAQVQSSCRRCSRVGSNSAAASGPPAASARSPRLRQARLDQEAESGLQQLRAGHRTRVEIPVNGGG